MIGNLLVGSDVSMGPYFINDILKYTYIYIYTYRAPGGVLGASWAVLGASWGSWRLGVVLGRL